MFCRKCGSELPASATRCHACGYPIATAQQKNLHVAVWIVGALIFCAILWSASVHKNNVTGNAPMTSTYDSVTGTDDPATSTTDPSESTAPETPKKWVQVAKFSGSSKKQTAPFQLGAGQKRLTYTVRGKQPLAYFYLFPEGYNPDESGGSPEALVNAPGTDTTYLDEEAGSYYLYVLAANCHWVVTIEEEK